MTDAVYQYLSKTEEETKDFGRRVAKIAQKGDIFALFGTLGMGKSVFSRAFIQSFLKDTDVPSPTFTLLQTYETPNFDIYHFDLYRLKEAEEIFELGMEEAMYQGVCLIEWPENMGGYLPRRAISIKITPQAEGRLFEVFCTQEEDKKRFNQLNGKR